jgi:hypothetical protein
MYQVLSSLNWQNASISLITRSQDLFITRPPAHEVNPSLTIFIYINFQVRNDLWFCHRSGFTVNSPSNRTTPMTPSTFPYQGTPLRPSISTNTTCPNAHNIHHTVGYRLLMGNAGGIPSPLMTHPGLTQGHHLCATLSLAHSYTMHVMWTPLSFSWPLRSPLSPHKKCKPSTIY